MYSHGIYHVAGHGSDDRVLFKDDEDRRSFLDHLETTFALLGLGIVSYLLMTNHHHLLVYTPDTRIEDGLRELHGGYARKHNRRHGRTSHLFRAHSLARRIEDDADLIWTDRYIAHNPVTAGMVLDPFDWPWGSAPAHAGLAPVPPLALYEQPLRGAYESRSEWRRHYHRYISAGTGKTPFPGPFE
jgi:putative transposase